MAFLTESSEWEDGIYQLETSDPVLGGPSGISNQQGKQLANRTLYLKDTLEATTAALELVDADLQDQIDAITSTGLKFVAVESKYDIYTVLTTDVGKLIRGTYLVGDGSYGQFTLPTADACGDGKTLAFINAITENSTRVPLIRAGADTIWVNNTSYTTFYLRPGDFCVLVANTTLNRWEAIVYNRKDGNTPVGTVIAFAADAAPSGYLACSGQAVSQTTYADLYALIGTTYNTGGEGAGNFRLPDLRGEFVRGWDNGRGVDVDRDFGSAQAELVGPHSHNIRYTLDAATTGGAARIGGLLDWPITDTIGDPAENRPRNVALLYCIKF